MEERHKRPTPTSDAGNFLQFIKEELISIVEKEYRADPSRRILVGHSCGGLFGVFALFEAPGLFDTLIKSSHQARRHSDSTRQAPLARLGDSWQSRAGSS
jgi:uncharacterized protein